jgi:hypothetical protein
MILVQPREPIERRCGRSWNLAACGVAVILIVIASGLRVGAGMPQQAPATSTTGKVFQCRVTDKDTGKPIAGAKVLVRISVTDPTTHTRNTLAEIRQRTSAEGTYSFHVSPEIGDPQSGRGHYQGVDLHVEDEESGAKDRATLLAS